MSLKILMIIGAILAVVGVIVGTLILFNTIKQEGKVYFWGQERVVNEDVEKSGKVIGKMAFILIIIGVAMFISCRVIIDMPRGNNSIAAKNAEGVSTGEDETKQQGINARSGESISAEGTNTIVIKEKTIYFGEDTWDDNNMDDFSRYLDNIEKSRRLNLQDDYAVSSTYHKVEELLKEHGIFYESEERKEY